jgi:hypothetical protein
MAFVLFGSSEQWLPEDRSNKWKMGLREPLRTLRRRENPRELVGGSDAKDHRVGEETKPNLPGLKNLRLAATRLQREQRMRRYLVALLSCLTLIRVAVAAPPLDIFPQSLQGTKSYELGAVVLAMMPTTKTQIGWDWQSDSPVAWQNGYTQNPGASRSYRDGYIRINVMGEVATVLRQRRNELGWTVEMYTDGPPKFGPEAISFFPGNNAGGQCFGTLYEGCIFNPMPSLTRAGIVAQLLCQFDESGRPTTSNGNSTRTYKLSARGKVPVLFQWSESEGSGGGSTTATLVLKQTPSQACKPLPM